MQTAYFETNSSPEWPMFLKKQIEVSSFYLVCPRRTAPTCVLLASMRCNDSMKTATVRTYDSYNSASYSSSVSMPSLSRSPKCGCVGRTIVQENRTEHVPLLAWSNPGEKHETCSPSRHKIMIKASIRPARS